MKKGKFVMESINVYKKRELFPTPSVTANVNHIPQKKKSHLDSVI